MTTAIRVLYVDDEPDLLDISKLFLEESGDFIVTTAISADEGIRLLEQEKFDAIISDYQMPGMDGIQFLVEVRKRFGPIPFILFTGRGREEIVIQAINSGADFYLQKGGEPGAQFAELAHKVKAAASSKRADDALRKSEEKYRHVIENSNEAIVVAQDGMLKLVNHKTIEFTGYSEQELLSMQFSAFIHPDDRAMVVERYQKRIKGEEGPSRYAFRLSSKDGSTRWVEIGVVVIDWDGRPATLNFLTDITERKRADDSLREEQHFSKLILDSLPGIFYLYTYPENRMVRWNKQHETLLGYKAEEIKGKLGTDLHLPEHKDAVLKAIDDVMEKGQSSVESTLMAKDGHQIPFFFTGVRFETPGQLYFMGIGIDISERKRAEEALLKNTEELHASYEQLTASEEELRQNVDDLSRTEQALRESEEKFHSLYLHMTEGAALHKLTYNEKGIPEDYIVIETNPAFERQLGISRDAIIGKTSRKAYGLNEPPFLEIYARVALTGKPEIFETYFPPLAKHFSISAYCPGKGRFATIFEDITERKLAGEALTENEKRLRTTLEILPVGVFIFSKNGQILTANSMVNRIWGVAEGVVPHSSDMQEFVEYKGWWPDTGVALRPEDWAASRVLIKGEAAPVDIVNIRRFDGSFGTIIVSAVPYHDDRGNVTGAVAVIQDITEIKRVEEELLQKNEDLHASYEQLTASEEELRGNLDELTRQEEALRESKRELADIIEFLPDATFVIDRQAIVIAWNRAMEEMTGIRAEDMLGKGNYEYAIPFYGERRPILIDLVMMQDSDVLNKYSSVQKVGDSLTAETNLTRLGGKDLHLWGKSVLIKNSHGEVVGAIESIRDITAWKHTEMKLVSAKEHLKEAHHLAGIGTWDWVIETDTVTWSEELCNISGWDPSLPAPTYAELPRIYSPASWEQLSAAVTNTLNTGEPYNLELELIRPDGSIRWTNAFGGVQRDGNGKITGLHGTVQDITERKHDREALIRSEKLHRTILQTIAEGFWIVDSKGKVLDVNETYCRMSGYTRAELLNLGITDLDVIEEPTETAERIQRIITIGSEIFETSHRRKDGSVFEVEVSTTYLNQNGGKFVCFCRDITKRKQAEEVLKESREFLHKIINSLTDPIHVKDRQHRIILINDAACRLFNRPRQEIIGKTAYDLFCGKEMADISWHKDEEVFRTGEESVNEETNTYALGKTLTVLVKKTLYTDTAKNQFLVGITTDITERKRAEEALKETNEYLNNLFDYANAPIIVWDPNFVITRFNHAFEDLTLISAQEIIGQRLDILFPKESRDTSLLQIKKTLEGERWETVEIPILIKDGNVRTVLWNSANIIDTHGRIISTIAQGVDITEGKRAEAALAESFATFRTVLDSLDALVYVADMKTHEILFVNQYGRKIFGDITGKICWKSIQVDQKGPCPFCTNEKLLDSDGNPTGILIWEFKNTINGHWYECHDSAIRWTDGRIVRIEIATDITDRKQVDEVLRGREERFRGLVDTITSGVAIYEVMNDGASGKDYIIKDFNKTALEIEGKKKDEVIGKILSDLRPAIDEYGLIPVFKKVWETGVPAYFPQKVYVDEKYSNWYENRVFRLESGEIVAVYDDVTERKRAEETLRESEERYNSLFTNNNSVSLLIDPDTGMIVDANAAACKYYGYSPEQIRGMGIYEINRIVKEIVIRNLKEAKTEKERHFFSTHFLSDGRQRNVEIYSGPILVNGKTLFYSIIHDVTDRVKAEEELKISRRFIEHTLSTTPALIYIYDVVEQRNVYTNRGIFEALGYTPEEISAMGQDLFFRILNPDDADRVGQHHARFSSLPDSTVAEIEYRMKHADGSWRWLHSRDVVFQRTPDGAVKQILGSSIDITDRKMVEEALRESERRMRDIISFLPDATLVIDKNGMVLAWNRAMEEMTGVPAEQMIGKGNYEYALPFYHERRPITVDLVLHDDPAIVEKYPFMLKDGRSRRSEIFIPHLNKGRGAYLWFMASPLYDADGNLMGAIESIRDITDRKQAEDAIQKNKETYRELVESISDVIFEIDCDGKISYISPVVQKVLEFKPEEMIGKNFIGFVYPDDRDLLNRRFSELLEGLEHPSDYRVTTKSGNVRWVRTQTKSIMMEKKFCGARGTLIDITLRKQAEDALRQSNKKLNLLSSITRHDINNQMTVLQGYLAILKKKQPDPALIDYFQKAAIAAQRISSMIRFTKEYESIGVTAPVWQDCRSLVDTAAKETPLGQVIVKNDLPAVGEIFADPLIGKVFYNLMDNAVRYGGKITTIRFSVEERDGDRVVVCEDDGDGVIAEEKEKIFERGFGKNTGLGLALAREILDITGITIRETGEPGKGARFEMMMPKGAWRVTVADI